MIPYFNWHLSGLDHQTFARIREEKCLQGREKEMRVSDVSPPLIPPPLCLSKRLRQLFDLMLFPDDLSVYSSCCVVSIGHRGNSHPSVLTFFCHFSWTHISLTWKSCLCIVLVHLAHAKVFYLVPLCLAVSLSWRMSTLLSPILFHVCLSPCPPVVRASWRIRPSRLWCLPVSSQRRPSASRCPSTRETLFRSSRSSARNCLSSNLRLATAALRCPVKRSLR